MESSNLLKNKSYVLLDEYLFLQYDKSFRNQSDFIISCGIASFPFPKLLEKRISVRGFLGSLNDIEDTSKPV